MDATNPFSQIAEQYTGLPDAIRRPLVTRAIGTVIPFVETAGCFIEEYTPTRVAVRLDNRTAVQNHLGGVHAAALALLAETASGLVVALNVPPASSPLLRTMNVSFERFAADAVLAAATLSHEEADDIRSRAIGRIDVDVTLTAPDDNTTLVSSSLEWAWLPNERLSGDE